MILNPVKVKGATGSCLKKHISAAAVHFTTQTDASLGKKKD
jgi:hypothetical protein